VSPIARASARPAPPPEAVAAELRPVLGSLFRRIRLGKQSGDLSLSESATLGRLNRAGPSTGAALAKLERISPQSMAATVAVLEARGLVGRRRDPDDGRRVILELTAAGEETIEARRAEKTAQLTQALSTFDADERARLADVIPLLARLAEEL
jgi:DNA-binding MarR family transcriptional regulator